MPIIFWFWLYICGVFMSNNLTFVIASLVYCDEESTNELTPIIWPKTLESPAKVDSIPMCLNSERELITRICNASSWVPNRNDVPNCASTQTRATAIPCPPNFSPVYDIEKKFKFCYQLIEAESWNYPCLKYGSLKTIYDLDTMEIFLLMKQLDFLDKKLVWLPAKRIIPFGPITWTIPGENWGKAVEFGDRIKFTRLPITQSCLLLDLDNFTVKTDNCSFHYPSICIFKDSHVLPLHCPEGYATTRYQFSNGQCYGLELSDSPKTWDDFVDNQCGKPLQMTTHLENYLFYEVSRIRNYNMKKLCWTALLRNNGTYFWYPNSTVSFVNWDAKTMFTQRYDVRGSINENYQWTLSKDTKGLQCMACQVQSPKTDIEMSLQYVRETDKLLLTIYNFKYLWKEDEDDPGVQCFTNAKGFVDIVDIEDKAYRQVKFSLRQLIPDNIEALPANVVEKVVYEVEIVEEKAGEYWCEGHTSTGFEFISTNRVLVISADPDEHVFALKLEVTNFCNDPITCNPDLEMEMEDLESVLEVNSVRIMEIENIDDNGTATILTHINVELSNNDQCRGIQRCNIVRAYIFILTVCQVSLSTVSKYKYLSLTSTMFCLPTADQFGLHWDITLIGDNTAPNEFCMQHNGLPVTRVCGGTFVSGGKWKNVMGECSQNYEASNATSYLYSLAKGKTDVETASTFITQDMNVILNDTEVLIPADIYFLSLSLKTIVELSDQNSSSIELGDSINIATAIDSVMNVDESYLNLAQTMNSSNVLLESIDLIISKIAQNESDILLEMDDGVDLAITPLFIIQISNPASSNITGLAIARKNGVNSLLFTEMNVIPLTSNTTIKEVLKIDGLEVATWIPVELLTSIAMLNRTDNSTNNGNSSLPIIIIEIFYNDVVFQETKKEKDVVNSRIVSVTLPGYESDLPIPLPLIYRRFDKNASTDRSCSYWDFKAKNPHSLGQWSTRGCYNVIDHGELDVCACFHLTHFAQLVLGNRVGSENPSDIIILQYHGRALNAITLVGCSLSLIGVSGIAATALIFKTWRQKPGTKVLLQLSAAIALQSIMMVSQDGWYESDTDCIILGVLLHYSVLAAFMWMLITAILQFARYVKVLGVQRPTRFLVKFSLAGWGLPLIPVAILLIVDHKAYLPPNSATVPSERDPAALCYPQGLGLYLGVLLPIVCIVITNLTVFILVMRSITRGPDGKRRTSDPEIVSSQLRLSVLLFFLLGLSWIFGLLAITGDGIIFSYLFCLTATLQGFVLFIYFVICDPATRVLWVSLVRERSISKDSTVS